MIRKEKKIEGNLRLGILYLYARREKSERKSTDFLLFQAVRESDTLLGKARFLDLDGEKRGKKAKKRDARFK